MFIADLSYVEETQQTVDGGWYYGFAYAGAKGSNNSLAFGKVSFAYGGSHTSTLAIAGVGSGSSSHSYGHSFAAG